LRCCRVLRACLCLVLGHLRCLWRDRERRPVATSQRLTWDAQRGTDPIPRPSLAARLLDGGALRSVGL
jgi:hypothetical protein